MNLYLAGLATYAILLNYGQIDPPSNGGREREGRLLDSFMYRSGCKFGIQGGVHLAIRKPKLLEPETYVRD